MASYNVNEVTKAMAAEGFESKCEVCSTHDNLRRIAWIEGSPVFFCADHKAHLRSCWRCGGTATRWISALDTALNVTKRVYMCEATKCKAYLTQANGDRPEVLRWGDALVQ